jgi:hypothetical protein
MPALIPHVATRTHYTTPTTSMLLPHIVSATDNAHMSRLFVKRPIFKFTQKKEVKKQTSNEQITVTEKNNLSQNLVK